MTMDEANRLYNIPLDILKEYESWGLCSCGTTEENRYEDEDIQRLSIIMTLRDVGFSRSETKQYMQLLLSEKNTLEERLQILSAHRRTTLDEIHDKQKQLDCLDYLRYKLQKEIRVQQKKI